MTDYRTSSAEPVITHVEEAAFAPLAVAHLKRVAQAVTQTYKNFVLVDVNRHCVRMAVMEGEFRWHKHPKSDECFLVLEGELEIDLADGRTLVLKPGELCTIPAGVVHRSRSRKRAVNLCFEDKDAYTDVVFQDPKQTRNCR